MYSSILLYYSIRCYTEYAMDDAFGLVFCYGGAPVSTDDSHHAFEYVSSCLILYLQGFPIC